MFGGGAPQEDMFAKLDAMREIITEVNTQFKDPVSLPFDLPSCARSLPHETPSANPLVVGENDIRLCLHLGILVIIRD
jgi:hypothetical protein